MCFHHRNSNDKEFEWNKLKFKSFDIIKNELDKCDLLCYNCHSEHHYSENNIKISDDSLKRRKDKEILLSLKEKIECIECGYNKCVASLDFHHRNREDKSFMLGKKRIIYLSDEILNEIKKCDIICKNCHIKHHTNTKLFNENFDIIMKKVNNYKENKKLNHKNVFDLYLEGKGVVNISKFYNVNKSTISTIIKNMKSKILGE